MSEPLRRRWDESVHELLVEFMSSSNDQAPTPAAQLNQKAFDDISERWYHKVQSLYSEPHRAYHNWTHVEDVLSSLDFLLMQQRKQMILTERDTAVTTLAAFFHDVIYNPKSGTNEQDSADLFMEFVTELRQCEMQTLAPTELKSSDSIASKVMECILASASHISSSRKANQTNNTIVAIFLDADISILGKSSHIYDRYAGCIRKEYSFVEKEVYCSKRAEILEGFLPMDASSSQNPGSNNVKEHRFVFATEIGREEWEENARDNLKREIDMLRCGVIPCEDP